MRISATDYAEGGWDLADSLVSTGELTSRDCNYLKGSGKGPVPYPRLALRPGH